jgi:hypothetical protein
VQGIGYMVKSLGFWVGVGVVGLGMCYYVVSRVDGS